MKPALVLASTEPASRKSERVAEKPPSASEIHSRVLRCPALFVTDRHGSEALDALLQEADIDPAVLEASGWISAAQLEAFLHGLRDLVADDDAFKNACTYRIDEGYGFIRHVFAALTPALVLKLAASSISLVSTIHDAEVLDEGRNRIRFRVRSTMPQHESRMVCLSRQAQSASTPTLFGLPVATLVEHRCMARGDDACEYDYSFYTRSRWIFAFFGLCVGLAAAALLVHLGAAMPSLWISVPLVGALIGALIEVRRTYRGNLAHGEEIQRAMREVASHEADARREILDMQRRQREWTKLMEEQVAERTRTLQEVIARIRSMGEARVTNLRGLSHDLRNPLAVLVANNAYMRMSEGQDPEVSELLSDNDTALMRMENMLRDLVGSAQTEALFVRLSPERLATEPLVEVLRRRLRALVFGRDVRVSVFRTREAPAEIETDRQVFERVLDNLCTNAVKYTSKGSIVLELDGTPGFLVVKVSDTGCGIEESRIDRIFSSEGSGPDRRAADSLGVGLSVVVQLLEQIGGRIEVMSQVGSGTTFWAYFPEKVRQQPGTASRAPRASESPKNQLVTIRRMSA